MRSLLRWADRRKTVDAERERVLTAIQHRKVAHLDAMCEMDAGSRSYQTAWAMLAEACIIEQIIRDG